MDDLKMLRALRKLRKRKHHHLSETIDGPAKIMALASCVAMVLESAVPRNPSIHRRRWDSEYLWNLAVNEGSFVAEYRLRPQHYCELETLLEPFLCKNQEMACRAMNSSQSKPISVASRLGAALIMLSGGRQIEAMRTHGLAKATVYANLHDVVTAINKCDALKVECDNSLDALLKRAAGFQLRSTFALFKYMTGAIDGLAISIFAPSKRRVKNQIRFHSGSKKKFCLNMQGVCDADTIFLAATCKHVGSTNDVTAFETSSLLELNQSQPFPFHWGGDGAYSPSSTMVVPFSGINLHEHARDLDSFNFWLGQLRITI